jgi:hypothetical protein
LLTYLPLFIHHHLPPLIIFALANTVSVTTTRSSCVADALTVSLLAGVGLNDDWISTTEVLAAPATKEVASVVPAPFRTGAAEEVEFRNVPQVPKAGWQLAALHQASPMPQKPEELQQGPQVEPLQVLPLPQEPSVVMVRELEGVDVDAPVDADEAGLDADEEDGAALEAEADCAGGVSAIEADDVD